MFPGNNKQPNKTILIGLIFLLFAACSSVPKESGDNHYIKESIPDGAAIAIVLQEHNAFENAILMEFLEAGYQVKAISNNDFNNPNELYDEASLAELDEVPFTKASAVASQLSFYKHEVAKIEAINQFEESGIEYIVLIELTGWKDGYSWVRVLDTANQDLIYLHNFKLEKNDTVKTILSKIINQMKQGP